jgi:hypothetical protein
MWWRDSYRTGSASSAILAPFRGWESTEDSGKRLEQGGKDKERNAARMLGTQRAFAHLAFTFDTVQIPFPRLAHAAASPEAAERAEGMPYQSLDILKKVSRGLAIPPKQMERCGKEIGRRVGPHRFPKLGDGRYWQCAQCVWSAFAVPCVSKPLRLSARPVGPCCLPGA